MLIISSLYLEQALKIGATLRLGMLLMPMLLMPMLLVPVLTSELKPAFRDNVNLSCAHKKRDFSTFQGIPVSIPDTKSYYRRTFALN